MREGRHWVCNSRSSVWYAHREHFLVQCTCFHTLKSANELIFSPYKICGTNIGTTILLARVLQSWLSSAASGEVDPKVRLGSIYALALGSNFGAYTFSFSASLAGLLWRDILRQKGIAVSQRQFAYFNLPIIAVAVLVSGAILIAQVHVVPR